MNFSKKAITLLSGGVDSSVNFLWALSHYEVARTLTFDYGQRAAAKEIEYAGKLSKKMGIKQEVIQLPYLETWTQTALVKKKKLLPKLSPEELEHKMKTQNSAKEVWVPNRNGIFLNIAAALAESLHIQYLVVGFNAEEGATFPDNSPGFIKAVNDSLFYSTLTHVKVICKTLHKNKTQIVKLGIKLNLPFELLWSCYQGGEKMCGICESCLRLKRAVQISAPSKQEVLSFAH
jgi:7-cyano-7-deazaguanine synthase